MCFMCLCYYPLSLHSQPQTPEPGPRTCREDTTDALEIICVVPLLSDLCLSHAGPTSWKLLLILLGQPSYPDYNLRPWEGRAVRMPCTPSNIKNTRVALPALPIKWHSSAAQVLVGVYFVHWKSMKILEARLSLSARGNMNAPMSQINYCGGGEGGGPGSQSCKLAKPIHNNSCSETKV